MEVAECESFEGVHQDMEVDCSTLKGRGAHRGRVRDEWRTAKPLPGRVGAVAGVAERSTPKLLNLVTECQQSASRQLMRARVGLQSSRSKGAVRGFIVCTRMTGSIRLGSSKASLGAKPTRPYQFGWATSADVSRACAVEA